MTLTLTMTRIGIYAPNGDGHRFTYVQHLLLHMPAVDHEVTLLTTANALRSDNYAVHLASLDKRFKTYVVAHDRPGLLPAYSRDLNTDLMVLPDGDSFAWQQAWRKGWSGSGTITALVMRSSGQRGGAVRRVATHLAKKTLFAAGNARRNVRLLRLESALWDPAISEDGVPDPVTFRPDYGALSALLPTHAFGCTVKWIGVVGALDRRKNITLVLEAALRVQTDGFGIILAGRMDKTVSNEVDVALAQLQDRHIPVLKLDRLLTDGQLDALLTRLHCVVLAHSNEGPSGILGKCVKAGTFVVAAGAHSLRDDCRLLPESSRWSPLTAEELAYSIDRALGISEVATRDLRTVETFAERLLRLPSTEDRIC